MPIGTYGVWTDCDTFRFRNGTPGGAWLKLAAAKGLKSLFPIRGGTALTLRRRLSQGWELAGFASFLDRHDIAAGEDWEARLGSLIRQADTVVFVVSPEAVKSERCTWEVNKALAETKRLLPVIFKPVPDVEIPHELQRRQFVHFDGGLGVNRPLAQLAAALRQDLDWVREHTRLGELAGRWEARGRPTWRARPSRAAGSLSGSRFDRIEKLPMTHPG